MFDHLQIAVSDLAASERSAGATSDLRADYYGGFLLDPDGNNIEVVNPTGATV